MNGRTSATSIAARARKVAAMPIGERRTREVENLAHRIYAEAHRLHMGNHEVIALFDDSSIFRLKPGFIRSLRLLERRKLLRQLGNEPGHMPRAPGHSIQYRRLQQTCRNILDPPSHNIESTA